MKKAQFAKIILCTFFTMLFSCSKSNISPRKVRVVLEEGDFNCGNRIIEAKKGEDVTFQISVGNGKGVVSSSYEDYSMVEFDNDSFVNVKVTFHNVMYSMVVTLGIGENSSCLYLDYDNESLEKEQSSRNNHLRSNTLTDPYLFCLDDEYLIGYRDEKDNFYGLGSRVSRDVDKLYVCKASELETDHFTYHLEENGIVLDGIISSGKDIVIPDEIGGFKVKKISGGFLKNTELDRLVLPPTLQAVEEDAFESCSIKELFFFDKLIEVSDDSFKNTNIETVHINAITAPKYSGTYYDSYVDKIDYLDFIKDNKKIILYSGSSTRFGYTSNLIDQEFSDYDVVNMGVFAYTPSLVQIDIINNYVNAGDILITSPEFDTIENQIDLTNRIDSTFFNMCEADYDIISLLDVSKYSEFFNAFGAYNSIRSRMPDRSYDMSINQYDEDGAMTSKSTYNKYGDYILYRENNVERKNFGIKRAFYNKEYFLSEYIERFNAGYKMLSDSGVQVLFSYSPRMNNSISEDSSLETALELGKYLENNINMPFLDKIQDSLMDPLYFHGTDNHLSTEGAEIRTKKTVADLKDYFAKEVI